jgi:phospholipase C
MENEEYSSVIGSSSAPYENNLANQYALAGNYYGVFHPSLPNYLAMTTGSTLGTSTDCLPAQCSFSVSAITNLIDSHGLSWKAYEESMPIACDQTESPDGLYDVNHDPFVYIDGITGNSGSGGTSSYCNSHVVNYQNFANDLASGNLPSFSFITPNINDDGHNTNVAYADNWLANNVPQILNSASFASTALFIVYDEGVTNLNGGGHVYSILVSPFAKNGYTSNVQYSHYSLLATVERIFGLGNLGRNDASASPMSDLCKIAI